MKQSTLVLASLLLGLSALGGVSGCASNSSVVIEGDRGPPWPPLAALDRVFCVWGILPPRRGGQPLHLIYLVTSADDVLERAGRIQFEDVWSAVWRQVADLSLLLVA
jgi:hypothetical protein